MRLIWRLCPFDELFIGPKCRYPGCNNYVFFDRTVNELREWCSDEHMRCAVYLHLNDSELAYISLGLQFSVVGRSPVGNVGYGRVAMAIGIAVAMFAGTHIHVRELASRLPDHSMPCNFWVADFGLGDSLVSCINWPRDIHLFNVDCIFPRATVTLVDMVGICRNLCTWTGTSTLNASTFNSQVIHRDTS